MPRGVYPHKTGPRGALGPYKTFRRPQQQGLWGLIGQRIAACRTAAGVTQADLAKRIGVSRASIANAEAGYQRMPLERLYVIGLALDCAIWDLLPDVQQYRQASAV